jgi:putative chitinase
MRSGVTVRQAIAGFMEAKEQLDDLGVMDNLNRLSILFGQTGHESSGYRQKRESTHYTSAERIKAVFGRGKAGRARFPTLASCQPYVRNKRNLANYVYQNRLGNGDAASGDGWKYRGAGYLQLTGRSNFRTYGNLIGVDLERWPELAATPKTAWLIAAAFFQITKRGGKNLFTWADVYDIKSVTRGVNGGTNGLADRILRTDAARAAMQRTWPQ